MLITREFKREGEQIRGESRHRKELLRSQRYRKPPANLKNNCHPRTKRKAIRGKGRVIARVTTEKKERNAFVARRIQRFIREEKRRSLAGSSTSLGNARKPFASPVCLESGKTSEIKASAPDQERKTEARNVSERADAAHNVESTRRKQGNTHTKGEGRGLCLKHTTPTRLDGLRKSHFSVAMAKKARSKKKRAEAERERRKGGVARYSDGAQTPIKEASSREGRFTGTGRWVSL